MSTTQRARQGNVREFHNTVQEAARTFVDVITDDVTFTGGMQAGTVSVNAKLPPTSVDGAPAPLMNVPLTPAALGQVATRSSVPTAYARRIHSEHTLLWADTMRTLYPKAPSLIRTSLGANGRQVRAVLSDKYAATDNSDVFTTVMQALVNEGLSQNEVTFRGDFDSDRGSMTIDIAVPHIAVAARELVADYRSPFSKLSGRDMPMVFAGLTVRNNECGSGAFALGPKAIIEVCANGMTRPVDQFRQIHLGGKLEQGTVIWSEETRSKRLEFISSAASDAIRKFLSPEYVQELINEAMEAKGIEVVDTTQTISRLVKFADLTVDEGESVLAMFIDGGDRSLLGLAQAVTAMAQTATHGDRQAELEDQFFKIVHAPQLVAV